MTYGVLEKGCRCILEAMASIDEECHLLMELAAGILNGRPTARLATLRTTQTQTEVIEIIRPWKL